MGLPTSPNTTYVDDSLPAIAAKDLNDLQNFLSQLWNNRSVALLGTGSDGSYTLDGVQPAVAGLFSKSGSIYTLLRDAQFVNLTVKASLGAQLNTANFRIVCTGTCTTDGANAIVNNGNPGTSGNGGGAGGPAGSAGSLGQGASGGAGGSPGVGAPGVNAAVSDGGSGGAGGSGGGGNVGGAAGTASVPPSVYSSRRQHFDPILSPYVLTPPTTIQVLLPGAGGGGGGATTLAGGGGGGGAGVIVIGCRSLIVATALDILAQGGQGAPGAIGIGPPNTGGGGGGGGGVIFLAYVTKALAGGGTPVFSGAANCPGGGGGSGSGTGTVGAVGVAGTFYEFQL